MMTHKTNRCLFGVCGYHETTCARCGGCGSRLRSPFAGGCNVPSAFCSPPSESVGHNRMCHTRC